MKQSPTIHVIDRDTRRRQHIIRLALEAGWHAEPYDSLAELSGRMPQHGFLLVEAGENGLAEAIILLDLAGVWLPIIGFRENPAASEIVEAMLIGASGYLSWPIAAHELNRALEIAAPAAPESPIAAAREIGRDRLTQQRAKLAISTLSPRESQVLDQIVNGRPSREIAEILQISARTIEIHRANLMRKLNARGVAEVVRIAFEASLWDKRFARATGFARSDGPFEAPTSQAA